MSTLRKRRIAILVSLVLAFGLACSCRLLRGTSISFSAFADEPTFAQIGTARLSDAGNTLFIRMAKFNVGTEEEPKIRYCSGFTVGDLGPEDNPTQNVNMDVLTPIWPDAALTGTLDKDIYICGGADSMTADLYVNGLTQTEGHKLTAVGSFDVKMGALSVGEMIAPTAGVNIGDQASVTVNGNASLNYLWMYKPSLNDLEEGQADPRTYNPQLLGGTLHVTGYLSGGSGGYLYIDGGSAATVDGDVSGLNNRQWQCIQVSNEGSLTVGGGISVPGGVAISNSALSVTEGVSAQNVVVNGGSAMNVGGDLSGGQIWAQESSFTVGGSLSAETALFFKLTETATVGGDLSATNLYVYGTGDASTSKTALTVTGDVSVSTWLDINSCATVTADDVICTHLYMEEAGPNVLNAATFKCTSDSCLYRNSTLNVTGDCTLDTSRFNVQGDSHVNVGGDLTVKNIDVQDKSSLTVEGEAYSLQLQAFGSGVITCKGNVAAKGAVSALSGGKIAVAGKLSATDGSSVNAMWGGSEITAGVIDAITVNALYGGKIAVDGKLSAATYSLSVNAMWGGSEITAAVMDTEGCVSAIGNARVSVTGTLTTGVGVFAIGKDAVVEAENINAPYINALGYYSDASGRGTSGTSAVIVRKDANLSQCPVVDDGGTISVGGDLNCQSFSISKQRYWNSEYTGWIRVGGDMRYAMNSGNISRGELTVGGDFINTATGTESYHGLAVFGGKLNVGGNVEFGSLLLNTAGNNTPLNVTGRINAARITDIIAKDGDTPLKLHTVAPFSYAETDAFGKIEYTQPWNTQYVMLADENNNSYYADVSDLTRISYSAVPATSISIACELNGQATWKNGAPCSIGYAGMSFTLPTGEDMTYADESYTLTGWSDNADCSGNVYTPGQSVTLNGDCTFYAIWSYNGNSPEITGANLVLDGTLNQGFHVALPTDFNDSSAHMVFTVHGRTIDVPLSKAKISTDAATRGQRIFSCPVYSIEMAEDVKAEFHYKDGGKDKTATLTSSVKKYLDKAQEQFPADDKLQALIAATRDYGHYIQPYLSRLHNFKIGSGGYAEMPAATASLEPATAQDLEPYKTKWTRYDPDLLESVSYYDTFAESTTLHVLVKLKSAKTVTATVNDESSKVTSLGNNMYGIEIPNIAANNLGKTYHVVFSADGAEFCNIDVSALTYVSAVLASGRNKADELAALTAFYNYYVAAKAYAN